MRVVQDLEVAKKRCAQTTIMTSPTTSTAGNSSASILSAPLRIWLNCCIADEESVTKRKRLDASMIGPPSNFCHIGHLGSGDTGPSPQLDVLQRQMRSKGGLAGAQAVPIPLSHLRLIDLPTDVNKMTSVRT